MQQGTFKPAACHSVNGIGNRTTSFLEQFIEDVIGAVVPNFSGSDNGRFRRSIPFS